jgi:anti-repressor protein
MENQRALTLNSGKEHFNLSIFEVINGKINLTKIAKNFGKVVSNWTKSQTTKDYLSAFESDIPNGASALISQKGGDGEQGTFTEHREVALELCRWISPRFAVWANKQIDTLLQTGKAELQPTKKLSTLDLLKEAVNEIEKLEAEKQQIIEETKPAVQFQLTVNNAINSITVADFAKIIGTGEIKCYDYLRKAGFLMNYPKNRPYQTYIDRGYFKVIEKTRTDHSTGESITYFQTLITGKGQTYLSKQYLDVGLINVTIKN